MASGPSSPSASHPLIIEDNRPNLTQTHGGSDAKVLFSTVWTVRSPQAVRANKHVCFERREETRREISFVCRGRQTREARSVEKKVQKAEWIRSCEDRTRRNTRSPRGRCPRYVYVRACEQ